MRNQAPTARDRRAERMIGLTLGTAIAFAIAALAVAAAVTHDNHAGTPQHTVRDFLLSAVVDRDGLDSCPYLTDRALRRVRAAEPRGMSCVTALAAARLVLGGRRIDDDAEVKALSYRTLPDGAEVRVTISAGGASRTFVLRRATRSEANAFKAPATPWRIDSGVLGLLASGRP
jgi:hypothetical protein